MRYLIDGYNLIFRSGLIKASLQSQREELIEIINQKAGALGLHCTLVFDATMNPGESTRSHVHHLEVVFTAHGETADEWIIQELEEKRTPKQFTVVTCDKQLAWYARQRHVSTLPIDEFMSMLYRRYANLQNQKKKKKQVSNHSKAFSHPSTSKNSVLLVPAVKKIPEGTPEYYLQEFESRFKENVQNEQALAKKPKMSKHKKKRQVQEEPYRDEVSEMERWERIFEERAKRF